MEFVSDVCNCAFLLCVTITVCNCKLCNLLNEWALIYTLLALCYVVAKSLLVGFMSIYSLLYSHERGQTFIQFLRANCMFIVNGLQNSYLPIPRFVCGIETLIPWALPLRFVLLYCTQTSGFGQKLLRSTYLWRNSYVLTNVRCTLHACIYIEYCI